MWNCLYNIDLYNAFTLSLCFFICYYYPVTKWKVKKWWEYYFLRLYLIDFCFIYSLYGTLNALIISTFVFLSIFSHARASYFDPGFVPLPKKGIDFSDVNTNDNTKVKYSIEFDSFKKKTISEFYCSKMLMAGRVCDERMKKSIVVVFLFSL